jgi:hypothetical protein
MRYSVTVRPDVARVGNGTRRRAGLTFSLRPTYLMVLPPEVVADPFLEVEELPVEAPAPEPEPEPETAEALGEPLPDPEPEPEPPAAPPRPARGRRTARKARR